MKIYNLFPCGIYNKSIQLDLSFDNPIWWLKILILFCILLSYYYMTIDHFRENYKKQSLKKSVVKRNIKKVYKNKKNNQIKKRNIKNRKINKNKKIKN